MIKKYTFFCFLVFLTLHTFAQQKELDLFNKKREQISKKGVTFITSWAAANIIYGTVAAGKADKSVKYFHEMNVIFNGVTLGIAGLGLLIAKNEELLTLEGSYKKQLSAEKLFLFNAGLDIAYVAGGAYLQEKAKTSLRNNYKYQGCGRSIIIQGTSLFILMVLCMLYIIATVNN